LDSFQNFNGIIEQLLSSLGLNNTEPPTPGKDKVKQSPLNITPVKALVILGLLTESMDVISVLFDKDQTIQLVLSGSLKRKTPLDKRLDDLGPMPFDDVIKAIKNRG
jgi:hypothetical protein